MDHFTRSPAAFLRYSLNRAAKGIGTPPDWWLGIRKAEELAHAKRARERRLGNNQESFPEKAMTCLENVKDEIFGTFLAAGQSSAEATRNARRFDEYVSQRSGGKGKAGKETS